MSAPPTQHQSSLPPLPLPPGVTSDYIDLRSVTGLTFHILEAGRASPSDPARPLLLLLHGFPELSFSWRKLLLPLANAGYHVVAVDQRGYGRTTGWEGDVASRGGSELGFAYTNLVRDLVALVLALGYRRVACVVGHDFGAVSAACCALMRPDMFRRLVLMSHPHKEMTHLPFDVRGAGAAKVNVAEGAAGRDIRTDLAALDPPRKHYKWYNTSPEAVKDWDHPKQGLEAFLRGYVHLKSADWKKNEPRRLAGWSAQELAKLPHYYVMPLHATMSEVVEEDMKGEDYTATKRWQPDDDLKVYVQEWQRTGFGGGLAWYGASTEPEKMHSVDLFAGKKIEVPAVFISGEKDWGNYQQPGALDTMPETCEDFRGIKMIKHAGHWPQQENPEQVIEEILAFLKQTS